jgi:uncharacterized phosphosugar-binding protein
MLGLGYITDLQNLMSEIRHQGSIFAKAGELIVDSAVDKGHLFIHDPSNMITYETLIRSGGLYMVRSLRLSDLPLSGLSSKDVVVFFSNRSYLQSELFFMNNIRERGVKVVGVFPSGMPTNGNPPLSDYCNLVINNTVPSNQGTLMIPGFSEKLGPVDVVVNSVIVWSLCAQIIGEFLRRGLTPSVYMTLRAQGAPEYDSKIWEQFQRQGY